MKATVSVQAKHHLKKIKALRNLEKSLGVVVGVLRGTGEHPNAKRGQTVAEIAWWNEFGTTRIPERPFLRTAVRSHQYYRAEVQDALSYALLALARGVPGYDAKLRLLGAKAQRDVQASINDGGWRENAESTKRRKSRGLESFDADTGKSLGWLKSQPLVDTGILRTSIAWEMIRGA